MCEDIWLGTYHSIRILCICLFPVPQSKFLEGCLSILAASRLRTWPYRLGVNVAQTTRRQLAPARSISSGPQCHSTVSQLSDVWAQTAARPNSQILRMIQYTKHSRPSLSMVSVTRGHLRAENIKRKMPERHDSWMLDRMPC